MVGRPDQTDHTTTNQRTDRQSAATRRCQQADLVGFVLRYRHPLFSDAAARRFADDYVGAVDRSLGL